ncbi:MAG: SET domain-containing protein-lysine N-methyltransferase [archaeon]|nr:SET domain-containing protein-lysine N-methyltransferase [archaeon]
MSNKQNSDNSENNPKMTERQAIKFLEKETSEPENKREKPTEILNYHEYYLYKKKESFDKLAKEIQTQRENYRKLSLKEFTQIKKNIFIDRKKVQFTEEESFQCVCTPKKFTAAEAKQIIESGYENKREDELFGCGKECLNKMVTWECLEGICPCGDSCRNRKFQNHEYADIYPIKTENRGFGLCAGSFIPKGTFIIQYLGEIYYTDSEYGQKKMAEYENKNCTYLMTLGKNEVIDPTVRGNWARLINHSCQPNCETQKWHVQGELCIGIFSIKDIQMDEELTFDYGFDLLKTTFQRCLCGSPNCRGYLGIMPLGTPAKNISSFECDACKQHCRQSEIIVVCERCTRIFHKKCASSKGKYSIETEGTPHQSFKCNHCIRKEEDKKSGLLLHSKTDEEPGTTESYKVNYNQLCVIKKHLCELTSFGVKLFWDYTQEKEALSSSDYLVEVKLTGMENQLQSLKLKLDELMQLKEEFYFKHNLQLPKIFVRKIIGHQNRHLNSYHVRYNVDIDYDTGLMSDEIYPLHECTTIEIKGTEERNIKIVEHEINEIIFKLKIHTIYLMPADYMLVRSDICDLKTKIDPADLRLRKKGTKGDKELKHPFYYITNNTCDLVIIGLESEIEKGRKEIMEFLQRKNILNNNYSLSFLFPKFLKNQLLAFKKQKETYLKENNVYIDITDPKHLRRHLCVYIEGKWKYIIEMKNLIWKESSKENLTQDSSYLNPNIRKNSLEEFQQYAFNQEHKLASKGIKNYILEQNSQFKNWDYISIDIEKIQNKAIAEKLMNKKTKPLIKAKSNSDGFDLIEGLIQSNDKETKLNYLIDLMPGGYESVFNMKQSEVAQNMFDVFNEAYEGYKERGTLSFTSEGKYESNYYGDISSSSFDTYQRQSKKYDRDEYDINSRQSLNGPKSISKKDYFNEPLPIPSKLNKSTIIPQKFNSENENKEKLGNTDPTNIYNFSNIKQFNISINIDGKNFKDTPTTQMERPMEIKAPSHSDTKDFLQRKRESKSRIKSPSPKNQSSHQKDSYPSKHHYHNDNYDKNKGKYYSNYNENPSVSNGRNNYYYQNRYETGKYKDRQRSSSSKSDSNERHQKKYNNHGFYSAPEKYFPNNERYQNSERYHGNEYQSNSDKYHNVDTYQGGNYRYQGSNDGFQRPNDRYQGNRGKYGFKYGNNSYQSYPSINLSSGNDAFNSGEYYGDSEQNKESKFSSGNGGYKGYYAGGNPRPYEETRYNQNKKNFYYKKDYGKDYSKDFYKGNYYNNQSYSKSKSRSKSKSESRKYKSNY